MGEFRGTVTFPNGNSMSMNWFYSGMFVPPAHLPEYWKLPASP